jgi:hypothetical protein
MLKIEIGQPRPDRVTVHLEGRLVGPWVEALRRACEDHLGGGGRLTVDFTRVSFVDRDGVALCRRLRDGRVRLENCSPFVRGQLDA